MEGSASTPGDAALKGSMQLSVFGHTKPDVFATISGGQYTKDKVLQVSPFFLRILNQKLGEFGTLRDDSAIQIHTASLILPTLLLR